ncbi:hypothetical protein DPMN_006153 [Dreissena polymorpha]|uniref:Uncharacterized protein n=1 Tax=Dreissena polymorpha TaxID=45954 RepID=A0A9D4MU15_DREPO|nr:hypothetical protein DPMN_006153 [Dreissena polymorpha]
MLTSAYTASSYQEDPEIQILLYQAEELYSSILRGKTAQALHVLTIRSNSKRLKRKKNEHAQTSKTSQLLLNYHLPYAYCKARMLIKAGCTGCLMMHFQTVSNCVSVFAVAGYFNYLRSAYNYFKPTYSLYETHPEVYQKFVNGCRSATK